MKRYLIMILPVALLVGMCITSTGCMMFFLPPAGGSPRSWLSLSARIQPAPEKHGIWSNDEISAITEAIATAAKHHGLKQKKMYTLLALLGLKDSTEVDNYIAWYTLPREKAYLKAYYTYVWGGLSKHKTFKIIVDFVYINDRTIEEMKELWEEMEEMFELLQNKFSVRIEYQGWKYRGSSHGDELNRHGFRASMSRAYHLQDNAHMESFFHSMKAEWIRERSFQNFAKLESSLRAYILFYNCCRLHSGINYYMPLEYERIAV